MAGNAGGTGPKESGPVGKRGAGTRPPLLRLSVINRLPSFPEEEEDTGGWPDSMTPQQLASDSLATVWSSAVYAGRKGEDRTVAVRRPWPSGQEGTQLEAPPSLRRSASLGAPSMLLASRRQEPAMPSYHLFAVFDGHNGAEAARFAAHTVAHIVEAFLPPWGASELFPAEPAEERLAVQLQEGLAQACLELERQFAMTGCMSGCTATLVLQVGRMLTVASLGSGRCVLDPGDGGLLALSKEHHISRNVSERQRLLAAGCNLAAVDAGGVGPADVAWRGSGVLRVWPGGLTLSRSIGDFAIGQAVLPLPHIKQVLLPPSGGRLVLASDGVWSQAGERLLRTMHTAPLKTAAHEVVRAISTSRDSRVDASIVVVDVLPPGDSFQSLCKRQEQGPAAAPAAAGDPGQAQAGRGGGGRGVLRMLGLGRSRSSKAAAGPAPGELALPANAAPAGAATVLADFDMAALLGLVPQIPAVAGSSRGSSLVPSPSLSRTSSSNSRAGALAAAAAAAAALAPAGHAPADEQRSKAQQAAPAWFDEEVELQMRNTLAEAHQLWQLARRRRQAAAGTASRQDTLQRLSRASCSDSDLLWVEEAAAGGALPSPSQRPAPGSGSSGSGSEGLPEASPFAAAAPLPRRQAAHHQAALASGAPLLLRSPSLPRATSQPGLIKQHSMPAGRGAGLPPLPPTPAPGQDRGTGAGAGATRRSDSEDDAASDSGQTVLSYASSSGPAPAAADWAGGGHGHSDSMPRGAAAIADLLAPRRRLPPLHVPAREAQPGPRLPGAVHRGSSGVQPRSASPLPTPSLTGGVSSGHRSRLPRSASSAAALLSTTSARSIAPHTPHTPSEAAAAAAQRAKQKQPSPRQLAASPNSRWLNAYNLTAGFFTKAGSGSMRRHSSADTLLTGASRG